jgi:hypothetical protein
MAVPVTTGRLGVALAWLDADFKLIRQAKNADRV